MLPLTPVAIVTDSAAGIPSELLAAYAISVVSFHVRVGERTYRDGIDIQPAAFFRLLRQQSEPDVSTGVPSLEALLEVYQRCASWARSIVSIHLAGAQSAMCDAARSAAAESPIPVVVVDSGSTAMGEGFVALEAARAAQQGADLDAVVRRAHEVACNVGLYALLESVTYAVKGGRLARAARLLGTFLNIHPLVRVADNAVDLIGQVRRRSQGIAQLIEKIAQQAGDRPVHLTIHYAEDEGEARDVLARLQQRLKCVEAYLTPVPVALGAHAGPGSLGIAYYVEM